MTKIEELELILESIIKLFATSRYGVNHLEFIFLDVCRMLSEDIHLKQYFFEKLMMNVHEPKVLLDVKNIPNGYIDSDLLCFIAHYTRWQEFYIFIDERKIYIHDKYSKDLADDIILALDDEWVDKDFYVSFS